jgi:quinoprotein glucose dehydrogenase
MPWILTMVDISESRHAQKGQRIYNQYCATCHGLNREGDPQQTFPGLMGLPKKMSKMEATRLVEEGKGFMPSFRFLSDSEQQAVVGFLFGAVSERTMRKWKYPYPQATTAFSMPTDILWSSPCGVLPHDLIPVIT